MKRIEFGPIEVRILNGAPRFYIRLWRRVIMYWPKENWRRCLEFTAAIMLLTACLTLVPGCPVQQTPTTQPVTVTPARLLSATTESLTATLNTLATARDLGLVTQAELNTYKPAIDAAYAARNAAERDIRAGNVTNVQGQLDQVQAALVQLQPLLAKAAAKKAATQPGQ